ncbi:hypothetical protein [Bradyrhizobium campsiandrae]|uniref:Uncharacterized protein n=2 Tax=Bradyrhizobium campsiandrae TaxID=1729892 RepID=A0ABR7UDW4_9BRAD|nr:hypothetical protein [Bradyrhizobium campsiandrae]MBC9982165.1 hypothetical protein [Bradyrhizobium campsiandrae]
MEGLRQHAAGPVSETCDLYQQTITVSGAPFWQFLQAARLEAAEMGVTISVTDHSDDYELLDDDLEEFSERAFSIRIVKVPHPDTLKFFTIDGFCRSAATESSRFESVENVLIAEIDFESTSAGLIVRPWIDDSSTSSPTQSVDAAPSPRRLVNDMSGKGLVPTSVSTWIVADAWLRDKILNVASYRLSLCLPDAVSIDDDGKAVAHLRSGRKVIAAVAPLSSWTSPELLSTLSDVCEWIYLEGRDAETRHSLLSAELVRLWQTDSSWQDGLRESLEGAFASARTAYRLHIQSKGVDAFKLMSDLRKGLADDVRSLANNTSSLSSGLWRDAAVAFGVIAVRLASTTVGDWLLWMAAAYLLASCIFSCIAASSAVSGIVENEKSFRSRLYGPLLLDKEYEELAGKHYRQAESNFRWYRRFIVLAYLIVVAVLLGIAHYGFRTSDNFFHMVISSL